MAYGFGPMLDWLVNERGIAPHIPVIDKSGRRIGNYERADFASMLLAKGSKEFSGGCAKPVIGTHSNDTE